MQGRSNERRRAYPASTGDFARHGPGRHEGHIATWASEENGGWGAEEGEKVGRLHENAMEKEKRETGA